MMKIIDLCSGIGGFSYAAERLVGGFETVLFCDNDKWCRRVLKKHWPNVPIESDVRELARDPDGLIPATDARRTILCSGYPCQPFSVAGKQRGEEDDRHIWPQIFTIVKARQPAWCIFENVTGHVTLGLDQVLSDLESEGYAIQTFIIPACAVNAPHRRDRLWLVAHTSSGECSTGSEKPRVLPSLQSDRAKHHNASGRSENVADTDNQGPQGRLHWRQGAEWQSEHGYIGCGSSTYGQSREEWWAVEPSMGRVAHGVRGRMDRLRGLGNAIVPSVVAPIFQAIKDVSKGDYDEIQD